MNNNITSTVVAGSSEALPATLERKVPVVWSDCFWIPEISRTPLKNRAQHRRTRSDVITHSNDSGPAFVTHSAFGEGAP